MGTMGRAARTANPARTIYARSSDQAPTPAPAHPTTCFSTLYATGGGRAALAPGGAVGLRFGLRRPSSYSAGAIETLYYPFSRDVNRLRYQQTYPGEEEGAAPPNHTKLLQCGSIPRIRTNVKEGARLISVQTRAS